MKVLIADDSRAFVERLKEMIAASPDVQVVGQASNAIETLKLADELRPDVLILDLHMPQGSGYDVLEGIIRKRIATVVVILTNLAFPSVRDRCLKAGANFFLDKSTEFEKVPLLLTQLALHSTAVAEKPS